MRGAQSILRAVRLVQYCDMGTWQHTHVQAHSVCSTESESQCQLRTFRDVCQGRSVSCNKCPPLWGILTVGRLRVWGTENMWGISVRSSQFFCEPTTLKYSLKSYWSLVMWKNAFKVRFGS